LRMIPACVAAALAAVCMGCAGVAVLGGRRDHALRSAGVMPRVRRRWGPAARGIAARHVPLVAATLAAPVAFLLTGVIGAIACFAGAATVPRLVRRRRARRGADSMQAQLAVALSGIAAALRAGLSLSQAIRFAAGESE